MQKKMICIIHGVLLFSVPNIKNWDDIGDLAVQGEDLTFEP